MCGRMRSIGLLSDQAKIGMKEFCLFVIFQPHLHRFINEPTDKMHVFVPSKQVRLPLDYPLDGEGSSLPYYGIPSTDFYTERCTATRIFCLCGMRQKAPCIKSSNPKAP